jgi:uncharacterized protein (UPF0333 family)
MVLNTIQGPAGKLLHEDPGFYITDVTKNSSNAVTRGQVLIYSTGWMPARNDVSNKDEGPFAVAVEAQAAAETAVRVLKQGVVSVVTTATVTDGQYLCISEGASAHGQVRAYTGSTFTLVVGQTDGARTGSGTIPMIIAGP